MKRERQPIELTHTQAAYVDTSFFDYSHRRCCTSASLFDGLKFIGRNLVAFSAGFLLAMIIRACIGAASKSEPAIIGAHNGTELVITDVLSCITTLLLCHFWIKPMKTNRSTICCDPKLLLRTTIRDSIPLIFCLASVFLVKFIDVEVNGP